MLILGLQKLTLLDFPGRIACTVFLGGCNMRCPYCHNGSLALGQGSDAISEDQLLAFLDSRGGRLDGVCISGGEPTLHRDLPDLMRRIKTRGFDIKLDTNGTNPEMLKYLIEERLVDYVAMDIKNSPEKYSLTSGITENPARKCFADSEKAKTADGEPLNRGNLPLLDKIRASAHILMEKSVDFEFRTTIMRELHGAEDMISIGKWLSGDEKYYLQTYRDEGDLLVGGFTSYNKEEMAELLNILRKYIPNADMR